MPPKKRSRRSFAASEERLISICLAEEEGGAPLAADRLLLGAASECASGLPADAASWDLSGLLVDGQPVRRKVVLAWLHAVMQQIHSQLFSEPQQEPSLATSATGLAQLLSFADAVGSSDGVLEACLPQPLEELCFRLAAGGEQELELEAGGAFWWRGDEPELELCRQEADQETDSELATLPSAEAKAALVQQFASQLEALLCLAHQLELDSLVALLHSCMRYNTAWPQSLLWHADSVIDPRVMSARVLETAAGPQATQQAQVAFITSIITEPCSFVDDGWTRQVFRPLNLTAEQKQPVRFEAELTEGFMGAGSKGQRVDVELDLFGKSVIKVGSATHLVQLLVGRRVSDAHFAALQGTCRA